jgi:thymidylate synthase (FAD)
MRIVQPSVKLLHVTPDPERVIELAGRVCYKSEDKITSDSHVAFIKMILDPKKAHESVLEHASAGFHIICDRGISHELVRHRIASYSQESTRYCNYSKGKFGNEISVVRPSGISSCSRADVYEAWVAGCEEAERTYLKLLATGTSAQNARSVLPTCLKTEVVMTANFREWRHFLKLRMSVAAHPDMRIIAEMIHFHLITIAPIVFEDLKSI